LITAKRKNSTENPASLANDTKYLKQKGRIGGFLAFARNDI